MDVVDAEQAKVAEDAGAVAVMALERVPADIRRDGGVARMSDPALIEGIKAAVTVPVMAKARIGHFAEAQVLDGAGCRLHRRERGADPGRRGAPHRQVGLRGPVRLRGHQPRGGVATHLRGRGHDPLQGGGRYRQHRRGRPAPPLHPRRHPAGSPRPTAAEQYRWAKELAAPIGLVQEIASTGRLPVPLVLRRGDRHPGRRLTGHAARSRGGLRRLGHLQERRPGPDGPGRGGGHRPLHRRRSGGQGVHRPRAAPCPARRSAPSACTSPSVAGEQRPAGPASAGPTRPGR